MPLFGSNISNGTRHFKNRAMQRHAQMLPACRCMARFLKGQLDILKSLPQSSSRVGPYYDGIGVMVVGRRWSAGHRRGIGGAGNFEMAGRNFGGHKKCVRRLDQKSKKPDRPSLSHKGENQCVIFVSIDSLQTIRSFPSELQTPTLQLFVHPSSWGMHP